MPRGILSEEARMNRVTLGFVFLAIVVSACGGSASMGTASGPPIPIGVLVDTSGPSSQYSLIVLNGIRTAVERINASGGVLGHPLKLIEESDGGAPSQSPTVVHHLLDQHVKAVLLASGSTSALQAKSAIEQAQVLAFSPANTNFAIANPPDNTYVYMAAVDSKVQGTLFATAMKKAGSQKVAILIDDSPAQTANFPPYLAAIKDAGMTVVDVEKVSLTTTDVSAQISRIKNAAPDTFFGLTVGGQIDSILWSAVSDQLPNVKLRFAGSASCSEPQIWKLAKPNAYDGVICGANISLDNKRTAEADRLIRAHVGSTYLGITAYDAQGFDGPYVLKAAIENAGSIDNASAFKDGMDKIRGYQPHWGNTTFTLSFGASKHNGADGNCGFVFEVFKGNAPGPAWPVYQPPCS
jgi:branched-chain amino acid transport system substrate-binding protein